MRLGYKLIYFFLSSVILIIFYMLLMPNEIVNNYTVNKHTVKETYNLKYRNYKILIDSKLYFSLKKEKSSHGLIEKVEHKDNCYIVNELKFCEYGNYFKLANIKNIKVKYNKTKDYLINENVKEQIIFWDYEKLIIFDNNKTYKYNLIADDYKMKSAYLFENYFIYLPLDINSYNKMKIINLNNHQLKEVELGYELSSNTYYIGEYKKDLYLVDPDSNNLYSFDFYTYELNWVNKIFNPQINFNQILINNEVFNKNTGYGYCKIKNNNIITLLNTTYRPISHYNGSDLTYLSCSEDTFYFVAGKRLLKLENNRLEALFINEELAYNPNQIIWVKK